MRLKVMLAAVLLSAIARAGDVPGDGSKEHPFVVDGDEIKQAYHDNEVAADQKFRGKFLLMHDRVSSVHKSLLGRIRISLSRDGESHFSDTICTLTKTEAQADKALKLKAGDPAVIYGQFKGFSLGGGIMAECEIRD